MTLAAGIGEMDRIAVRFSVNLRSAAGRIGDHGRQRCASDVRMIMTFAVGRG